MGLHKFNCGSEDMKPSRLLCFMDTYNERIIVPLVPDKQSLCAVIHESILSKTGHVMWPLYINVMLSVSPGGCGGSCAWGSIH